MANVKEKVDAVFAALTRGELQRGTAREESGWGMELPSGKTAVRSQLERAATPLIDLGPEAVPELLRWATNKNLALRYVAVSALERITGLQPFLSHFDREDKEGNRAKALEQWRKWYEQRKK